MRTVIKYTQPTIQKKNTQTYFYYLCESQSYLMENSMRSLKQGVRVRLCLGKVGQPGSELQMGPPRQAQAQQGEADHHTVKKAPSRCPLN